jgi:hypothetical protein
LLINPLRLLPILSLCVACTIDVPTPQELKAAAEAPVTRVIGPEGDLLRGPGVVIEVPKGALTEDTELSVRLTRERPTAPWKSVSFVYEFEPFDVVFNEPVTVELSFKKAPAETVPTMVWSGFDVDAGLNLDAGLVLLESEVVDRTVRAQTTRFGRAFVAAIVEQDPEDTASDAGTGSL